MALHHRAACLPVLAFTAGPAWAAAGEKADPFAGGLAVTIVTLIVFLGLIVLLRQTAYPTIIKALQEREKKIAESLEAATRAEAQLRAAGDQVETQLAAARKQAEQIVEQAKQAAADAAAAEIARARTEINTEKLRAEREIGIARDAALEQVAEHAANLAVDLAGKVIQRELSPDDHRDFIRSTIATLGR